MYEFYLTKYGIDSAEMLYKALKNHNLETVEKCQDTLPIVIECFEPESLQKFGTLSDLPLVQLMDVE